MVPGLNPSHCKPYGRGNRAQSLLKSASQPEARGLRWPGQGARDPAASCESGKRSLDAPNLSKSAGVVKMHLLQYQWPVWMLFEVYVNHPCLVALSTGCRGWQRV